MNMNSKKTEIPVVTEAPRASLAARIKSKIKGAAQAVVATVKAAATTVARVVRKVAPKAWGKVASAWRGVIRPVLKAWSKWTAAALWAISLVIAPVATITATLVVVGLVLAIAYAWDHLEQQSTRAARFGARMIKTFVRITRAAFYAVMGATVLLMASVSVPLAALLIADFALTAMTGSSMMDEPVAKVTGLDNLDVPTIKRRQKIEIVPSTTKPKAIRALGAEEMFDMNACEACGTIEGTLRVRSAHVPFATAGNVGTVEESERPMLCGECFDAECEDIALSLTGTSLKARNVELRFNERGLTTLPQFASSLENSDTLYWTTTATAWWRDRRGDNHERAWSCFHNGKVVATVTFAHRNRTFVATVRGKVIGSQRTLVGAKALANDILMDERNAAAVFVEAIGGIAEASA